MQFLRARIAGFICGAIACALAACAPPSAPPVVNKTPHRVIPVTVEAKPGDTVYTLGWEYGVDPQDIIKWNRLAKPHQIRPGRRLQLRAPGNVGAHTSTQNASAKVTPPKVTPPKVTPPKVTPPKVANAKTTAPKVSTPKVSRAAPGKWRWPAKGNVIAKFSRNRGHNGIKIAGAAGSKIVATAAGEVVYAGEGLRGYGKLIIIEHSPSYLSAYAHNRKILVREGARIKSGQQIAQMGDSGAERVMLHFEIRKSGKPVDPLRYLK